MICFPLLVIVSRYDLRSLGFVIRMANPLPVSLSIMAVRFTELTCEQVYARSGLLFFLLSLWSVNTSLGVRSCSIIFVGFIYFIGDVLLLSFFGFFDFS